MGPTCTLSTKQCKAVRTVLARGEDRISEIECSTSTRGEADFNRQPPHTTAHVATPAALGCTGPRYAKQSIDAHVAWLSCEP